VYVSAIRSLTDSPFFTGSNQITTISVSGFTSSPMSILRAVISVPFSVSTFSFWPVSRMYADGFDERLPGRTDVDVLCRCPRALRCSRGTGRRQCVSGCCRK
jgi:hypothetical protein